MEGVLLVGGESLAWSYHPPTNPSANTQILFVLHGAGQSTQERTTYLVDPLIQAGHGIFRFDYSGHGKSSGTLTESSLARRMTETLAMAEHLKTLVGHTRLVVMASSMGAHTAINLTQHLPVLGLILVVPAAYSYAAEILNFGPDFTTELRRPNSWQESPVWPVLKAFTKPSLVVEAENDEIIPAPVMNAYKNSSPHMQHYLVTEAPHALHKWLEGQPYAQAAMIRRLTNFLNEL